jgi:hypothetical protein
MNLDMRRTILFSCMLLALRVAGSPALEQGFAAPPAEAKPGVYWWWLNGNITREGITKDLTALQAQGFGRVLIFDMVPSATEVNAQGKRVQAIKKLIPQGPVGFMSEEWVDLVRHAVVEADRLGMQVSLNLCAGYNMGGPWIDVARSMKETVHSETAVAGGTLFRGRLAQPETRLDFYRDVAVLAVPARGGPQPTRLQQAAPTLAHGRAGAGLLIDGTTTSGALPFNPLGAPSARSLELRFARPFEADRLWVNASGKAMGLIEWTVHAGADESHAAQIASFKTDSGISFLAGFPRVSAEYFRITAGSTNAKARATDVAEMHLLAPGETSPENRSVRNLLMKTGLSEADFAGYHERTGDVPEEAVIRRDEIIDLTSALQPDGSLTWSAPPGGDWAVLRFGYTSTGRRVRYSFTREEDSLEVDKMSREAVGFHFRKMAKPILDRIGPLAGRGLAAFTEDSWECGLQNWTDLFPQAFAQRRGYSIVPWLPVLAGRVVESGEASDRFLWDFRQTQADLIAYDHYGELARLSHAANVQTSGEPGVPRRATYDPMLNYSQFDVPMGNFWFGDVETGLPRINPDVKLGASTIHLYGKRIMDTEAFTAAANDFRFTPATLRKMGDLAFLQGVNRFTIHGSVHQPDDRRPGLQLVPWGLDFTRKLTWFEQSGPYARSVARSSFLLQEGRFVGDVLYFYGENVPNGLIHAQLRGPAALPDGYDYDFCNRDALLTQLEPAGDGVRTADGTRYRVLVLHDEPEMTLALLRRLRELVSGGLVVLGPRPLRSPSLAERGGDAEWREIVNELWGTDADAKTVDRRLGRGRMVSGRPLAAVLSASKIEPDFRAGAENVGFIHRDTAEGQVYFIVNRSEQPVQCELSFRVADLRPEIWRPETGAIERPAVYRTEGGRVVLPWRLDAADSFFVVFREAAPAEHPVSLKGPHEGTAPGALLEEGGAWVLRATLAGNYRVTLAGGRRVETRIDALPADIPVKGPWRLSFPPGSRAPDKIAVAQLKSWTEFDAFDIRHFSGVATYETEIDLPADTFAVGRQWLLDLGEVRDIATVSVNGGPPTVLWKAPFRLDLSSGLNPGRNRLTVAVANLWANRLIGDQALPEDQRLTWTNARDYTGQSPLLPSGLLGPVRLMPVQRATVAQP